MAPDQGFLPAYTEGVFHEKDTDLVISRGLGNSVIPIRLLNRPELVKVTLYSKIRNSNKERERETYMNYEQALDKLTKYGQQHLLHFMGN